MNRCDLGLLLLSLIFEKSCPVDVELRLVDGEIVAHRPAKVHLSQFRSIIVSRKQHLGQIDNCTLIIVVWSSQDMENCKVPIQKNSREADPKTIAQACYRYSELVQRRFFSISI